MRVYELAKELNLPPKAILLELLKLGIPGKSNLSEIDSETAEQIRKVFIHHIPVPILPCQIPSQPPWYRRLDWFEVMMYAFLALFAGALGVALPALIHLLGEFIYSTFRPF